MASPMRGVPLSSIDEGTVSTLPFLAAFVFLSTGFCFRKFSPSPPMPPITTMKSGFCDKINSVETIGVEPSTLSAMFFSPSLLKISPGSVFELKPVSGVDENTASIFLQKSRFWILSRLRLRSLFAPCPLLCRFLRYFCRYRLHYLLLA